LGRRDRAEKGKREGRGQQRHWKRSGGYRWDGKVGASCNDAGFGLELYL